MIETLHAIPEMERTKEDDGFAYPEKYRDKLFYYKDQFLLFREASYDTFPKLIIETVVGTALENIATDIKESLPSADSIVIEVERKLKPTIDKILSGKQNEGITEDKVVKLFDTKIGEATILDRQDSFFCIYTAMDPIKVLKILIYKRLHTQTKTINRCLCTDLL